ncbi:hypothetical protein G7Y89_g14354 [Cudoniella acicularis]|uniref:Uncharacterized protein n=1 Tax=Cudoniella acicularis TaxID=354080 RepID=A0A8H4R6L7_9HELO|nr:hypothetical protein G7Y89_g14354 [Cudoniella acicularis]
MRVSNFGLVFSLASLALGLVIPSANPATGALSTRFAAAAPELQTINNVLTKKTVESVDEKREITEDQLVKRTTGDYIIQLTSVVTPKELSTLKEALHKDGITVSKAQQGGGRSIEVEKTTVAKLTAFKKTHPKVEGWVEKAAPNKTATFLVKLNLNVNEKVMGETKTAMEKVGMKILGSVGKNEIHVSNTNEQKLTAFKKTHPVVESWTEKWGTK